ncbi:MAG: toll/interleukin-1 receptor domain-containing protein [Candidatus Thiodiazotropha sp.]
MPTEADNKQPRFFLSYARGASDAYLVRFYKDLRREVAFREGLDNSAKNKEVGFRDTDDIPSGADWPNELADALRSSWACVSVYTPLYFKREYCGKEFQVFLDRANVQYDAEGAAENARCIVPVLWASMQDLQRHKFPPAVTKRINFRASKHQKRYEEEGLRQILKRSPKTAYEDILYDIVDDLIAKFPDHPAPLPQAPSIKQVNNAFATPPLTAAPLAAAQDATQDTAAARDTRLVLFVITPETSTSAFSSTGATEWLASLEEEDENLTLSTRYISPVTANADEIADKLSMHSSKNRLVVVLVDPVARTDHGQAVKDLLQSLTKNSAWTGSLLIPEAAPATDGNTLASRITLPEATAGRILVRAASEDPKLFVADLRRVALDLLKLIVAESSVQRRAPGGGAPKERPKIRGPVKDADNE